MKGKHWYPTADHELLPFAHNFSVKVGQNAGAWGIPSEIAQDLSAKTADYDAKLAANDGPNAGHLDKIAKDGAKKALIDYMTAVKNEYIQYNSKVSEIQRTEIGLPEQDTVKTPHPAPDLKPELEVEPAGKGKQTVTALNPQTKSRQKPPFVSGVAFAHRIRETGDPKSEAELMPSEYQTASTKDFQWGEKLYGKVCDYACAYEGVGGKRGPWSDVVSLIIT